MQREIRSLFIIACLGWALSAAAEGAELIERKTPSGKIVGYKDTPLLPWTGNKYHVHDPDRPEPKHVVTDPAGTRDRPGKAPSDAVVLFDGQDLSRWEPSSWKVEKGYAEVKQGSLKTKEAFGDCQLHLEWMAPAAPSGHMMNRGNSGVLLMGVYEIQIFDSHPMHAEQIYPDGQAASVYGQTPPLVNACRRPGEWQTFDIVFTAPVFEGEKLLRRAKLTMFHNGVLVHSGQEIMGPMTHRRIAPYQPHASKLPLILQGHGSPLRFRNIWIRPPSK